MRKTRHALGGYVSAGVTGTATGTATVAVPVATLLSYLAWLARPGTHPAIAVDVVLGNVVLGLPALVCLGRAVLVRSQRLAFALVGLGAAAYTAGNVAYMAYVQFQDPVPFPSVADIGYSAAYLLLFSAVLCLAWPEIRGVSRGRLLDGALSAMALAVVGSLVTLRPLLAALQGGLLARLAGGIYPVADLTLTGLITAVATLKGRRPGLTWALFGSGVVIFAFGDTYYLHLLATDSYRVGSVLDGTWAVGFNLMALAAALPHRPGRPGPDMSGFLFLPNAFSFVAVAILAYGSLTDGRLPVYVVVLTMLTLVTAVQRIALGFFALRRLAATERLARTDALTQLANRRHFDEHAQRLLGERAPAAPMALLMIDMNGFKQVNDTLGHQAGDELLRQLAPRLRRPLGPGDLLARLGGDEFGVLLADADAGRALAVADLLADGVREPYLIDGLVQHASASIGVALCPEHGDDVEILMQRADLAMFDAKAADGRVTVWRPEIGAGRTPLDVRRALSRGELFLEYQPQVDAAGQVYGVEALVRWRHPDLGVLPPARFLPLVERAGLMPELTAQVLDNAARDRQRWGQDGRNLRLSVNLAPSALLADDLVELLADVLKSAGLPPSALTLEITESLPVAETHRSLQALWELRALGVQLSLDDFGTGWASLSHLRDLPLDELKIDRSFVTGLMAGSADARIIASTVALAGSLGLRVVVEGVETEAAHRALADLGCTRFQGFRFGRPMPAADVPARIAIGRRTPVTLKDGG